MLLRKNTIGQYRDSSGRFVVTIRYDRFGNKSGYVVYDLTAKKQHHVNTLLEAAECVRSHRGR
jgi:hypothetical protein